MSPPTATELSLAPAHLNRAGDRRYRRSSSGAALTLEPFGGQQAFGRSAASVGSRIGHRGLPRRARFDLPVLPSGPGYWTDGHHAWEEGQDGTELVLNASYGVNVQLRRIRSGGGDPLNLYVAHQGLDLFESNRLILGLSLER